MAEPKAEPEWDTLTLEAKLDELGFGRDINKSNRDALSEQVMSADAAARLHEVLNGMAGASSIIAEVEERTDGVADCETCRAVHAIIVNDDDKAE